MHFFSTYIILLRYAIFTKKFYLLSIDISVLMVVAVVDKVRAACRCRSVVTARGKLYLSLKQFIVISASPLDLSRVTHLEAT